MSYQYISYQQSGSMNEQEYRLTEEDKLMLIEQLLNELSHVQNGLSVVRSDDALQGKSTHHHFHTYQILGSETIRKTQTSNLIQKVEDAHKLSAAHLHNNQVEQQISEESAAEKDDQQFRYFKDNIRCFRCKKMGHHNFACIDQPNCQYCLATDHYSERCPQRTVCYQCYEFGHVISECPAGVGSFCQDCKRKHNKVCCFLTKGIEPIKQMFNTDYLYTSENIRCMRCLEYGHLICYPKNQEQSEQNR